MKLNWFRKRREERAKADIALMQKGMTDEEKIKLVNEVMETAFTPMLFVFKVCEVPNFMTAILHNDFDDEYFEIKFERLNKGDNRIPSRAKHTIT